MKNKALLGLVALLFSPALGCADEGKGSKGKVLPGGNGTGGDGGEASVCGDGLVTGKEVCDLGEENGGYDSGCAADCMSFGAYCGDGVVQEEFESCDDGPMNNAYGYCNAGCNGPAAFCGNGFLESEHEACDDGERNGEYGFCDTDCQGPTVFCGDGIVTRPYESCDDGPLNGEPGHCPSDCDPTPGCGDGVLEEPELCDDGEQNGTYNHCAYDCSGMGPSCGDGERNPQFEACDDGELNGSYGYCSRDCQGLGPHCGDGIVQAGESCDDGALNGQEGRCNSSCSGRQTRWMAGPSDLLDVAFSSETCRDHDLLGKYLEYRKRFRGDGTARYPGFVSIGDGPGESMPVSYLDPYTDCGSNWQFDSCPRERHAGGRGIVKFGDTTLWLGEYIAMLALEYKMFADLGLETEETLSDLAYAMKGFNRVDLGAEAYFPGAEPALDGFYLRDDVPSDFVLRGDGSFRFPQEGEFQGYECVNSAAACEPPTTVDGHFVSQDQSTSLVMGLALVNKLVPDEESQHGIEFTKDAREMVHRIVWHMRKNGWKIKDPTGEVPPGEWGGNALGVSNAFAKVANEVVGDEHGVSDYRNFASRMAGETAWAGLQAIWNSTHAYNRGHALRLASVSGVWDDAKMPRWALKDGRDTYALIYAVLHDKVLKAPFSDWRIETLLHSAPCSGPCRGRACEKEVPGWMGASRVMSPQDRLGTRHFDGLFNGMDYMLTYSSYFLYKKGQIGTRRDNSGKVLCSLYNGMDKILADGAQDGQIYDPRTECAALVDFPKQFCRRPFGSWLRDAFEGKVTIFTGDYRWDCSSQETCVLQKGRGKNTSKDDLILGTPGDDVLSGGDGNDCLMGFEGDDKISGNQGYDEIHGGPGNDKLYGESSGLVLDGDGDVIFGGPGDDLLKGGPGRDELYGEDGHDTLEGGNGDDFLDGGNGNDILKGELGDDWLTGGPGDDWLYGGWGDDVLYGGPGRDRLDGDRGDDYLDGGTGPDFIRGGPGDDTLVSGDNWSTNELHHDRLCGNGGDDVLWGGWDGDECLGGGPILGGTDQVEGCEDGTAKRSDCTTSAMKKW